MIASLVKGVLAKDRRSVSKAITLIESTLESDQEAVQKLFKQLHEAKGNPQSLRVGLTGSPGVGKSTFIEELGTHLTTKKKKHIAILAIDPSSPRSGGSILGDKTRMPKLAVDPRAYIRPSPSRGDLGGVVASSFDTVRLCEYAGFDVVLVESVGVGQSELSLADLVDIYVLLLAPGTGDELQGIKKGITELADVILVNKCDPPLSMEARMTLFEYKSAMKFRPLSTRSADTPIPVLPVSAKTGHGIEEAWEAITSLNTRLTETGIIAKKRESQAHVWTRTSALHQLTQRFNDYCKSAQVSLDPAITMSESGSKLLRAFLDDRRAGAKTTC